MTARGRLNLQAFDALYDSPDWWSADAWRRFLALYDAELGGDKLYAVVARDAAVLVGRVTWRLMLKRDYRAADIELKRFLAHPEAEFGWEFQCRLALCALAQREEAQALFVFRGVLGSVPPAEKLLVASYIRNHLGGRLRRVQGLGPDWPRKGLASERMTGFVEELSAMIRNRSPRRNRFPARTSYTKLRRCLLKTFPPDRYAPVDLEGCDVMDAARRLCEEAVQQIRAGQ